MDSKPKPTTAIGSAIIIASILFVAIVAVVTVIGSNFAAPAQGMAMEKGNQTGMSSNMTSVNMTTAGNMTK